MSELKHTPVAELKLDMDNPRLPEDIDDRSQAGLLALFYTDYDLDELAASYVTNGFFESEGLIALKNGVVIEGNRRLAALKYLLHDKDAVAAQIPEYLGAADVDPDEIDALKNSIPVQYIDNRESLAAYLGFRHINGSKAWSSGAKARFVYQRVKHYESINEPNPLAAVAHEIGSNTVGVRNWYIYYGILKHAEDVGELNYASKHVLRGRFGVWRRVVNEDVYEYIGFAPMSMTLTDIDEALDSIDDDKLGALLNDLTPDEDGFVLLNDSRKASEYTTILRNEEALALLRSTRDYSLALSLAQGSPINQQMKRAMGILELVYNSLESGTHADDDSLKLIQRTAKKCTAIEALIKISMDPDE